MAIVYRLVKGLPLTFEEVDGNFEDLVDRSVTLDEQVDLNTAAILGLETDLGVLEGQVSGIDTDLTTLEGTVGTLSGSVSDLETDLGTLDDRVDLLETELGALDAAAVPYSNATSGLTADDVQEAIDEVVAQSANYVTLATTQSITAPKRMSITAANTGDFDFATGGNFSCVPTGAITLTLTVTTGSIAGQSGFIKLDNPSGYTIGAVTGFDFDSTFLALISTSGSYLIAYFAESNSKVNLLASNALT